MASGVFSPGPRSVVSEGSFDLRSWVSLCSSVIGNSLGTERVQKGIVHWDKQNHAVPAPNCMLKVRGEIIKDEGL